MELRARLQLLAVAASLALVAARSAGAFSAPSLGSGCRCASQSKQQPPVVVTAPRCRPHRRLCAAAPGGGAASDYFESWISQQRAFAVDPSVQHAAFEGGRLRGLAWTGGAANALMLVTKTKIASVPAAAVLSSDFTKDDWDRDLAVKLWNECQAGDESNVVGYCRLLLANTGDENNSNYAPAPASTAPHSLRHWSQPQKDLLATTSVGEALIDLEQRQEAAWRQKHAKIQGISWPSFQWAMEAVHSRAFCGVQADATSSLPSLAAPVIAAAVGYAYTMNSADASDAVLAGLAAVAVLPTLLSLTTKQQQQGASSAVLLPLIDSANHFEQADSSIDYDPIKNCFELRVGPGCLVREGDSTQLYISYGKKSDRELLLNYGFLPGVPQSESEDEYRRNLAEAFHKRNS